MKTKFTIIIIILTSYFLLLTSARSAYAHVLKTDGQIGAVLHMAPNDDPAAGSLTDFFFEFKDRSGKFNPEKCDCVGRILQDGKEIYSAPLFQVNDTPALDNASFAFTFPEKNIYKVQVVGKPVAEGEFESFTLTWDVRVERWAERDKVQNNVLNTNWFTGHAIHLLLIIPATIFMIYVIIKNKK